MNRNTGIALAVLAVTLVPVAIYLGVNVLPHAQNPYIAWWAPIAVLVLDALLFFAAMSPWKLAAWDRTGIAIALPLLLAMASWAVIINTVPAAQPGPAQMIQGD